MPLLEAIELGLIFGAPEIQTEYTNLNILDYSKLLAELSACNIALDNDPVKNGITKLNGLIAQIDAFKTRASSILSLAIKNESELESLYKKAQAVFQREYDYKLPQPPVSEFSNAQSREAACNSLLAQMKELVQSIEGSYAHARAFTKIVNNEFAKLDSTNKNISRQITVIQLAAEIGEIRRQGNTQPNGQYTFD